MKDGFASIAFKTSLVTLIGTFLFSFALVFLVGSEAIPSHGLIFGLLKYTSGAFMFAWMASALCVWFYDWKFFMARARGQDHGYVVVYFFLMLFFFPIGPIIVYWVEKTHGPVGQVEQEPTQRPS